MKDDELLDAIQRDWRQAGLDDRSGKILSYAEKLTVSPATIVEQDIETLREAGLADRDILQLAELVAYYAYVNRIASGLGVQLESNDDS